MARAEPSLPSFCTMHDEDAIRAHIHSHLDDYVKTYITPDRLSTYEIISNVSDASKKVRLAHVTLQALIDCLKPVSFIEPGVFSIPVHPLHVLAQKWQLDSLEPYDEEWQMDRQALEFIRRSRQLPSTKPMTERVWDIDDPGAILTL